jgi:hypothetical protein
MVAAVPAILDPLRDRDLALLFAGKAVSLAGDGVYMVALAWPVAALLGARATLIGAGALGLAATVAVWIAVPAVRAHHDAAVPGPRAGTVAQLTTRAGNPGSTASASAGGCAPGGNSPSTAPPKPPPIIRAPAAPAASKRSRAASTAGTEAS